MYEFLSDIIGLSDLASADKWVLIGSIGLVFVSIILGFKLISGLFHNLFD